ncbi:MAG: PTS galactosamine transporter subunit IIB [Iodobacter sp.]
MTSPQILLARIDNRLVHGQVGVTWTSAIGANLLVVVDDNAAGDELQQKLMAMTADQVGVGIRFFTIEKTIAVIHKASPTQKIFLVCRTPETVMRLVDGGVPIHDLTVGNMHFSEGKHPLSKKVYVDDTDLSILQKLKAQGINVFIQDTPSDLKADIPEGNHHA